MEKYDIVVVGGGPAGAAFAHTICDKYKVLLLDKKDYSDKKNGHKKCCGGLLNEDAQSILNLLGYTLPMDIFVYPQTCHVKVLDYDNNQSRTYYKGYLNIDREKFDAYLLSKASPKVEIKRGAVFHKFKKSDEGGYVLDYRHKGGLHAVKADIIVGADGAGSKIEREINPNDNNTYVAIQKVYKKNGDIACNYAIFNKQVNDYYSWMIPKDDTILLGSILDIKKDPLSRFALLEETIKKKENLLGDLIETHGALIRRPKRNIVFHGGKDIPLIGEAAGFISPSSSEGISYAIESGYLLAECLNKYDAKKGLKKYYSKCKKIEKRIKLKYLKSKLMYSPLIRGIIMRLGILSVKEYK